MNSGSEIECDGSDDDIGRLLAEGDLGRLGQPNENRMEEEDNSRIEKDTAGEASSSMSRGVKRNRVKDQEELWTMIGRGGKKIVLNVEEDDTRIIEEKVEICLSSKEVLPKQFGLARLLKQEEIANIVGIKYINPYEVTIQLNSDNSAQKLLENQSFKDKGYRCYRAMEITKSYGVIRNCDLELTEEEMLASLRSEREIVQVKRLERRNSEDGKREPCDVVRLCFNSSSLPTHVYVYDTRLKVDPYVFPVTQCSKCWRFGHLIKMCPSRKIICPKCGKFHENCETSEFKCVNCNGNHMALAKKCPTYLKEKRIRELMAEFNCTFRKASMMFVPPESPIPKITQNHSMECESAKPVNKSNSMDCSTYAQVAKTPIRTREGTRNASDALQCKGIDKKDASGSQLKVNLTTQPKKKPIRSSHKKQPANWFEGSDSWSLSSDSQEDKPNKVETQEPKNENNKTMSELFNKIKDIIWSKRSNLEEKIKECCTKVWEWLVQFAMKYITELPILKYIIQYNGE